MVDGGLVFVEDAQEALSLVQLRHLMIRKFVKAVGKGNRRKKMEAVGIRSHEGAPAEWKEAEGMCSRG